MCQPSRINGQTHVNRSLAVSRTLERLIARQTGPILWLRRFAIESDDQAPSLPDLDLA